MSDELPFWEKSYRESPDSSAFNNGKPSLDVIEVLEHKIQAGTVLDLGCGDGRHSLYAASRGFKVEAIDISDSGIQRLRALAKESGLRIDARVGDMRSFTFDFNYDLIISHGCLHLIHRNDWKELIKRIKHATMPGGYNIVVVFTDTIRPPKDLEPYMKGLFREGELYQSYQDWECIEKRSHILKDEHPGGIEHKHPINRIIARKPLAVTSGTP